MKQLMSTKEAATYLGVNEKMIYTLISEKGLPATKITGKWLFPAHLVEQWVEARTINFPANSTAPANSNSLVIAGSNDLLFDQLLRVFMEEHPEYLASFANVGSLGGIKAVRRGVCHMATSHLMADDDYNFAHAKQELEESPAIVNISFREQGYIVAAGNPKKITGTKDIAAQQLTVVNRSLGTGTRQLFDAQLFATGVDSATIAGYEHEVSRHLDVGLEVLAQRADIGPAIRAVANQLALDFIPVRWERFDLIIPKARFFDKPVQCFLALLNSSVFYELAAGLGGYDTSSSGKILYPEEA